ncbi:MAG: glycosyltransferase [Holosporales bacterium]|nr:glycosyltransferase [Holosporales bacterium]
MAVVESPEELPEKIELYLGQPKTRKAMGEAARSLCLLYAASP